MCCISWIVFSRLFFGGGGIKDSGYGMQNNSFYFPELKCKFVIWNMDYEIY